MTENEMKKVFAALLDSAEKSENIKFPNEALCIAHSIKVAMLKPGDIVYVQGTSFSNREAVFLSHNERGKLTVYYYGDDKEMAAMSVPPSCVTFEPVPATVAGTIE